MGRAYECSGQKSSRTVNVRDAFRFCVALGLTVMCNQIRIPESVGRCSLATHICLSCDYPGDGNCSVCHGTGKTLRDESSDTPGLPAYCPLVAVAATAKHAGAPAKSRLVVKAASGTHD